MEFIGKLGEVAKALTFIFGACVLGLLLLMPSMFGARLHGTLRALEEAGLQVEFAAVGLKAQLEQLQDATGDVDAEVLRLKEQLAAAQSELEEFRLGSFQPPPPVREPSTKIDGVEAILVELAPAWIVIAGAERDRTSQTAEVQRLQNAGYNAELYLAKGWYQTGIVFEGRDSAQAEVAAITKIVGQARAPYPRALDVFCPEEDRSDPNLVVCSS